MRYLALATDYDGTLAQDGHVDDATLAALEKLLATGRKLILVTGRDLDDLANSFAHFHLFEWIVAENGALLYRPSDKSAKPLSEPPKAEFIQALRDRKVDPVSIGRVIVATWQPHEASVLDAIRSVGLELQVIFNKGAVMVLPSGVNKASGLLAALAEMDLSPHNVVAVGDAENDHAMLALCECGVAVANALPAVKERSDLVTYGDHGAGVSELIDRLVDDDLRSLGIPRHELLLGHAADDAEVRIEPADSRLLICGASGSGKSTVATALVERLMEHGYQTCVIDPEGDYGSLEGAAILGNNERGPTIEEISQLLSKPAQHVVANLIGVPIVDRPSFFLSLLPRLQELRARTGRPHWIVVDEAHHVLPATWQPGELALPKDLDRVMWITVEPKLVAPAVLATVNTAIAAGETANAIITSFAQANSESVPAQPSARLARGEVLYWRRGQERAQLVRAQPGQKLKQRHSRKYAEGELPPDRSFFFRGPEGKLKLRAQNLYAFLELAEGVDAETWEFHLRRGDYSKWFRERIKDDELAEQAEAVERQSSLAPADSLAQIKAAIEEKYTLPSPATLPMAGTDAAGRFHDGQANENSDAEAPAS